MIRVSKSVPSLDAHCRHSIPSGREQALPIADLYHSLKDEFIPAGGREKQKLYTELQRQYRKIVLAAAKDVGAHDCHKVKERSRYGFVQSKTFQFPGKPVASGPVGNHLKHQMCGKKAPRSLTATRST
eukprot:753874-Hanusia_phi.AAC.2